MKRFTDIFFTLKVTLLDIWKVQQVAGPKYISKSIMVTRINSSFRHEMAETPGAEKFLLCFQCGTCTAGCPISRFSSLYNPRKIARMVQLGLKDKLLSDVALWLCTTCYTCIDNCPQGVEVASIVRILRNFSVKERRIMPLISKKLALNILKTGYAYVIPESRIRRRIARGLPHLPKSNLKQIAKLFEVTDFLDTIENAETFEKVEVKE